MGPRIFVGFDFSHSGVKVGCGEEPGGEKLYVGVRDDENDVGVPFTVGVGDATRVGATEDSVVAAVMFVSQ